jgi:hypothetical protein
MNRKKHGGENLYKFVGTTNDKFIKGNSYTYRELAEKTGLAIPTLRTRMGHIEGKVITDQVIAPKRKPFCRADGTNYSNSVVIPDRCETESEKMMNKYLRMCL